MYKITLTIQNPMTGGAESLNYQFNPTGLTEAKWVSAYPAVAAMLQSLRDRSAVPNAEPAVW